MCTLFLTAFSFRILPGPIFGSFPNLTSAFIPEITSLHIFTSSTITVEGKCQYLHPVRKCASIKSCKYWEEAGPEGPCQERGVRNNSCSKPEFQSVSYCHSWSHRSFAALTGSEPLGTKEKLPNLVTRFPKWQKSLLWELEQHPACPPHLFWDAGWFLAFVTGGHKPLEKSFHFWVGMFSFLFQVHLFHCYFLIVPPLPEWDSAADIMFTSEMFLAAWASQMNCSAYANRLCVYSVLCHCHSNQSHKRIEVWVINRNRFDLETWDKISISIQVTWIQITPWCRISPWHAEFVFALQTEGSLTQKEQRCGLVCMPGWVLCLCGCEWNKILNLWAWYRFSIRMLLSFYKQLDCRFHFPPTVVL